MEPTRPLMDELFWRKVDQARTMSPADKLLAGPRLFERSCRIMLFGIRDEFPQADVPARC